MTDGTSQGLFIVVAIVIFGIFVVLAYILFEDTLSPTLASMFTDATEQASEKLNKNITDERFFTIDETGKITAYTDYDTTDDKELPMDVVIPRTVNGVTVRIIGHAAFTNKGLTSVKIPNSVKEIEDSPIVYEGAFTGNKLKDLEIPGSIERIGSFAFMKSGAENLKLEEGLLTIGSHAFTTNNLKKLKLPNSVKYIGNYSFTDTNLNEITFGTGLEDIANYAFTSNKLTSIKLPSGIENIGVMAFKGNMLLNEIHVTEEVRNKLMTQSEFLVRTADYINGKFENRVYFSESTLKTY